MKHITSIWLAAIILVNILGCAKEEKHGPISSTGEAPAPVSNVRVENLPGAAKILYTLPQEPDLLYVEAEYEIRKGVQRKIKATFYNNSLTVDGFGTTEPYNVNLYAVNRNNKRSAPVAVTVNPAKPPVMSVFESIRVQADFGGINIQFSDNPKADLAIVTLAIDSASGKWKDADTKYTSAETGDYSVRGFASVKTTFGVFIRDRYNNYSDTLFTTLVPIFEQQLDKSKFTEVFLPGDFVATFFGSRIAYIWDDDHDSNVYSTTSHSTTDQTDLSGPHYFTFDMGVTAKLSRFKLWQVPEIYMYGHGNVRRMEVWVSTNPPPDGSFNGWTKAMEVEVVKPSGLPYGENSNEDVAAVTAGHEFSFPRDLPPARYIRLRNLENWSGTYFFQISEVTFWGTLQ